MTCSLRSSGEPRFRLVRSAYDKATARIAAVPKGRESTTSAGWSHGPPPKTAAQKEELDAQLDAWQLDANSASKRRPMHQVPDMKRFVLEGSFNQ